MVQRPALGLSLLLAFFVLVSQAAAMNAKEINDLVYKAEKLSMSGNIQEADEALKQAEQGMEAIQNGNDEDEKKKVKRVESKIKYVRKQLDRKLKRLPGKTSSAPSPPQKLQHSKPDKKQPAQLPDHALSHFKRIGSYLDEAKNYIDSNDISGAKLSIAGANRQIQMVERTFARYDAKNHPDVLAAKKRIPELETLMAGAGERKAKADALASAKQGKVKPLIDQLMTAHKKYKDQVDSMNANPRVFMPADLDRAKKALKYYNADYSGFESALREFTEVFGTDSASINAAFKKQGLKDKNSLAMYVPGWIKSLNNHEKSRKATGEMIVKSAKTMIEQKGFPADKMLKVLNENKEILKVGAQICPENPELNQILAGMDDRIEALKKTSADKIDNAVFKPHISEFKGPGKVESLAKAALDYLKNSPSWGKNKDRKMEMLKVTLQGQWQPAERNVLGYILSYRLPVMLAYTTPEYKKDNLAKAIELSVLTNKSSPGQAQKKPPFANYWVGDNYMMRLDKVK